MIRTTCLQPFLLALAVMSLSACAHLSDKDEPKLEDTSDTMVEAALEYLEPEKTEPPMAVIMPGQMKSVERVSQTNKTPLEPYQAISRANASAAIEPDADSFINAIQVYPYSEGALYQVYTAPEQVTDISLEMGEKLMSVSAGDTVRWILGDTVSGTGTNAKVHILVKPVTSGLTTNLIITTSKRTYHVEVRSFKRTYMAAVSWRYPQSARILQNQYTSPNAVHTGGLTIDELTFGYKIRGDRPAWRPLRAFDDGKKVFIQFPETLHQSEAPPLFVIGPDKKSQLINYRVSGSYYIVDRLFEKAELRLGGKRAKRVQIIRTSPANSNMAHQ